MSVCRTCEVLADCGTDWSGPLFYHLKHAARRFVSGHATLSGEGFQQCLLVSIYIISCLHLSLGTSSLLTAAPSYRPFNAEQPENFDIGLKSQFSLESMMLHYRPRGLCIQSSSRNVDDENTIDIVYVFAINEAGRFTPGMDFIVHVDRVFLLTASQVPVS